MSDGYNQLDSIIINKASAERGMLGCTYYTYEITELEKNEIVELPNDQTLEVKHDANYSKLDEKGIIRKGMLIQKGDVLVSKKQKVNKQGEEGT